VADAQHGCFQGVGGSSVQEGSTRTAQAIPHHGGDERMHEAVTPVVLDQHRRTQEHIDSVERFFLAAPACTMKRPKIEIGIEHRRRL
jgi:hypothetical protein